MTQAVLTRAGRPFDIAGITLEEWELLKAKSLLGDFVMPCCQSPAVLKTSPNGLPFFAHLSDVCQTAPETIWHKTGKTAVLAALETLGVTGFGEVPGESSQGDQWRADVHFQYEGRTIAIELQRSYQHLRDYLARQERYRLSNVECYWLVMREPFITLTDATAKLSLKREHNGKWPPGGIGTGCLPELPVAMLQNDEVQKVIFGLGKSATVIDWVVGIIKKQYRFDRGSWNLG